MNNTPPSRLIAQLVSLAAAGLAMVLVAWHVRLPLSPLTDFRVLYLATSGILRGVPLYDVEAQANITQTVLGATPEELPVIPFPYLPWLALGALFLGLLPIDAAMVLWLQINLVLLFAAVWLLTDGWEKLPRQVVFPAVFLYIPVLGTLAVGQYDLPILLGASMLIYGLRKDQTLLTAAGLWLVIIKPHLGLLLFIAAVVYLLFKNTRQAKNTLRTAIYTGVVLALLSFFADPAWIIKYPQSLLTYSGQKHITTCSECASLPMLAYRAFNWAPSLSQAAWVAIPVLMICAIIFIWYRKTILQNPQLLIGFMVITTLLASPYVYNYDFVLLLVPVLTLFNLQAQSPKPDGHARYLHVLIAWLPAITLLSCTLSIALWGRGGNVAFIIATLIIGALLIRQMAKIRAAHIVL